MKRFLALILLASACTAIDNYGKFRVVETIDGGSEDGNEITGDLTQAESDLAQGNDLARPDLTPACAASLSNVGAGDFTIRFTIQTKANVISTVLYQRMVCDMAEDFWSIGLMSNGALGIEMNQAGGGYALLKTTIPNNDGNPHNVIVQRQAGMLSATTDGVFSGGTTSPQTLGTLSPLGISKGNPCEGKDGTVSLVGTVTNVCITTP